MKRSFIILIMFFLTTMLNAQVGITGTVTDMESNPLIGATVSIKGTSTGTITDVKGKFNMNVPDAEAVIKVSYVGFLSKELKIGSQTNFSISLESEVKVLDEIMVIGYGVVKKSDLTGSVSSVTSDEMKKEAMTSLEQGIQGRAAGVFVTQTDASPGGGISIQIRGSNSMLGGTEPLYVIDGVPTSSNNSSYAPSQFSGGGYAGQDNQQLNVLSAINPSDIESIEILKDASATAIYGSRGANGVVIITTKRGKEGKSSISFEASYGISNIANKIEMLDPIAYSLYINEGRYNDIKKHPITGRITHGTPIYFNRDSVTGTNIRYIPIDGEGSDWQDVIYRQAKTNNYQLEFNGGTNKIRYAITGNYLDKEGIIVNSNFQRKSLRINLDSDVKEYLTIGTSTFISSSDNRMVSTSTRTDGNFGGVVKQALTSNPTKNISDWDPNVSPEEELTGSNPYVEATQPFNNREDLRLVSDIYANLKFSKSLSLRTNLATTANKARRENYFPKTTFRGYREKGSAFIGNQNALEVVSETQFNYYKVFNQHMISALGVLSYEKNSFGSEYLQASNFLMDDLLHYSIGDADQSTFNMGNDYVESTLLSYTGRINYKYGERFLVTATIRRDGSSKFGDGNKWGTFPSFAFAWKLSEESFLKDSRPFNNLKLRTSWGQSGNQAVNPLQSKSLLVSNEYPFNYPGIIHLQTGYLDYYGWFPNSNLQWETTTQTNIGLDGGISGNRITFSFDYYEKRTTDLLQYVLTAFSSGFTEGLQNAGEIKNRGIEMEVVAKLFTGAFQWDITGNYSRNRNEIISISPGYNQQFASALGEGSMKFSPFIQKPGLPLGAIWGYVEDGIFQNQEELTAFKVPTPNLKVGEIRYRDISGPNGVPDSIINDYDRVLIGDINPSYVFGITNNVSYKNLSLSVLLQGVIGQDVLNQTKMQISGTYDTYSNITREAYDNRWQGEGTSNTQPQALIGTGRSLQFSDRFVEDGSFIRVKNVSLSYTFNDLMKIPYLQVYMNASNLYTYTNYSGYDPEVGAFGQDPSRRGVDAGSYPFSRTYTFGIRMTL